MNFEKMANLISGGIDYLVYESEDGEEVKEVQEAEETLFELVNLLKEHGFSTVEEIKNVFNTIIKIREGLK